MPSRRRLTSSASSPQLLGDAFAGAGETLAFIADKIGLDLDPRALESLPADAFAAYKDLEPTIKALDTIRSIVADLDEIAGAGRPESSGSSPSSPTRSCRPLVSASLDKSPAM
jgi:hypothetical protein